jgi:hypothetical protein
LQVAGDSYDDPECNELEPSESAFGREDRLAGDEVGDEEKRELECVAAEDVRRRVIERMVSSGVDRFVTVVEAEASGRGGGR